MDQEAQLSIGLSVGAAVAVLALRLVSLLQAGGSLETGERAAREALDAHDARRLRSALRRLSAGVPFGDWTAELLAASTRADDDERRALLDQAERSAARRIGARAGRGHALDLAALGLTIGLSVFASSTFRLGSTFALLGCGSLVTLLVASLGVRAQLKSRTRAALARLTELLRQRAVQGGDSPLRERCPACGAPGALRAVQILLGGAPQEVTALGCSICGHLSAELDPRLLAAAEPVSPAPSSPRIASE